MALRTAYLAATEHDLGDQLEHAIRDRRTAIVYGIPAHRSRVARAILATETATGKPLHVTHEADRWVISR